ncbi:MAG: sigma-70 family RNA polymerase sigma factor [Actinomycetia bacterium]|nr:sigma-70 family RNA polymerase sigma factor [Actinomycetes bacterium]
MARVLVGDPEDAADLVAEAIANTLPRWRAGQVRDVGAYVHRVTVNLAARRWRRRLLARQRDRTALEWLPVQRDLADDIADRDPTLGAVMRLPPRRRAVVVLRFYEGLPHGEIAKLLGIREGTVKSQLFRALEQLRIDLGDLEEV